MSELENRAKAVIEPAAAGRDIILTEARCITLAAWFMKTVIVAESSVKSPVISEAERHALRETLRPPDSFDLWIGRGYPKQPRVALCGLPGEGPLVENKQQKLRHYMVIGQLALFGVRQPSNPALAWGKPDALTLVWPTDQQSAVMRWPPTLAFLTADDIESIAQST